MGRFSLISKCLTIILVGVVSLSVGGAMPGTIQEADLAALESLAEGSNKFAVALYQELSSRGGNVLVSPISLQMALAMAYCGAKGKTASEMQKVLGFPHETDLVLKGHLTLIQELQNPVLLLASKVFLDKNFSVEPEFKNVTSKYFLSTAEGVDFSHDPETGRLAVNKWVEDNTKSRIKDLLPAGSVTRATKVVLTNAIHFKANWEKPFPKSATIDAPFHVSPGETINVKMMHLKSKFGYKHDPQLKAKILEIPYQEKEFSMVIILPDEMSGLDDLEYRLASVNLADQLTNFNMVTVNVALPKFKLESSMDLGDVLQKLGIKAAFAAGEADFSGISTQEPLVVSKVIQKAFIEVNEEGTEAAAATEREVMKIEPRPFQRTPGLKVNRPFLFYIQANERAEKEAKIIILRGLIRNPKWSKAIVLSSEDECVTKCQ